MEKLFRRAKDLDEPVIIHCCTKKGNGYRKAEKSPERFHGTPPFFIENGETQKRSRRLYGQTAADELIAMAKKDDRIVAVTAAMPMGTAADRFKAKFKDRFFEWASRRSTRLPNSARAARAAWCPFFFVYSRSCSAVDSAATSVHAELPVVFLLDRAGVGNETADPPGAV